MANIPVIAEIEPSPVGNPAYGVTRDTYLIGGWRAVASVAARDLVPTGRRLEGMFVYTITEDIVWRLGAGLQNTDWVAVEPGGGWSDSREIYVDPAGDDDAPGTQADPIATIYELSKRVSDGGKTRVWFSAGDHELTAHDSSIATYENRTVLDGDKIYARGAVDVLETFTVASVSGNVVTAQGTPGWTVDEHANKWIRWFIWGPSWDDFGYGWRVLSNTADTVTVTASWGSPGLGGYVPAPTVGTSLEIVDKTSKIIRPPTSDAFTNKLFCDGRVIFQDIVFDGSGAESKWGVTGWTHGSYLELYWCEFLDHTINAVDAIGTVNSIGCYYRNSGNGIVASAGAGVATGDNFFDGCTVAVKGSLAFAHGDYGWARGVSLVFEGGANDGAIGWWLDNCTDFCRTDESGLYTKINVPLGGFDATARTLTGRVFYLIDPGGRVDLYNSTTSTVDALTPANFIVTPSTATTKANYVTNGKSVSFPGGRWVQG